MTKKPTDYEMALAGLEGLESKGLELAQRARIARQAILKGEAEALSFFVAMTLESSSAAEFWAGLVEKHREALLAGPTEAVGK